MPPNPPASPFAPSALGAALLGLSAALLAFDVGAGRRFSQRNARLTVAEPDSGP